MLISNNYLFFYPKVINKNNFNSKLLYDVIKKILKYILEPSNYKLKIIKYLLSSINLSLIKLFYIFYSLGDPSSNIVIFNNIFSDFCEILTRFHCDLKLFEATKFFIFRLYQAGFYYKGEDNAFNIYNIIGGFRPMRYSRSKINPRPNFSNLARFPLLDFSKNRFSTNNYSKYNIYL